MSDPSSLAVTPQSTKKVIYFNGFVVGIGNADCTLDLRIDSTEIVSARCSYTLAKTLSLKLAEAVARLEKVTNHNLMTTDEVLKGLRTLQSDSHDSPSK